MPFLGHWSPPPAVAGQGPIVYMRNLLGWAETGIHNEVRSREALPPPLAPEAARDEPRGTEKTNNKQVYTHRFR